MIREISAGGVVVQKVDGVWSMAVIELPADSKPNSAPKKRAPGAKAKPVTCLPKGLVDPGEKALDAAVREIREETGLVGEPITKLADIKYVYVRSWGDKERVFKIVSFYLLRYSSGTIDDVSEEMRVEVARAKWIPLADAPKMLAYSGEKQMARKAAEYLNEHPEL
jgi:8-oxo-dGTP pyrophosphatase MutT (NUDIX family)